jgi:hypothetical protein
MGWSGEKVRLVPLDRSLHLDNAVSWFNDPEVTAWTLAGDWPLGRLAESFRRGRRASRSRHRPTCSGGRDG